MGNSIAISCIDLFIKHHIQDCGQQESITATMGLRQGKAVMLLVELTHNLQASICSS